MSRGFTLIELLTVVAIMALLGVASTSGYNSLQRGIRERSAVAAASGLLCAAKERSAVDRVPTAVFCYNRMIRDTSADRDENAVVVGVMVAIRRAGRVTEYQSPLIYDEFGDLQLTYNCLGSRASLSTDGEAHDKSELESRPPMKLYRFPTSKTMEYSLVSDSVWCSDQNQVLFFSGTGTGGNMTNFLTSAFYKRSGSTHEAKWAVGDAYGFEIGEIQLPHGMIFGKKVPQNVSTISTPEVIIFDPDQDTDYTVEVNTAKAGASGRPEIFLKAGTATSDLDANK